MKSFIKQNLISLLRIISSSLLVAGGYYSGGISQYLPLGLYILAYIILCYDVLIGAFKELFDEKTVSDKMLMLLASLGAMMIGEFLEGNIILILYMVGKLFVSTVNASVKKSIEILEGLQTDRVRLKNGTVIPAKDAKVDDVLDVLKGERIAVDGVVVGGLGTVNTSAITGVNTPQKIGHGSKVLAGYVNNEAPISVKVTRPLECSMSQRIVNIAETCFDTKTKNEIFVERFSRIFSLIAIIVSALVALAPPIADMINPVFGGLGFAFWTYKALNILVIASAGAMVVSAPLAYFCGVKYASKKGILIKGSSVVDDLRNIEIMIFDKTSTLTRSELVVAKIDTYSESIDKIKLLQALAIVESKSEHPIARAIIGLAEKFNVEIPIGENYKETPGSGVECDSIYGHIMAGIKSFVGAPSGIAASVYVSINGEFVGTVDIGDQLKNNSKDVFEKLRKLGIKKKIIFAGDKKYKVDLVVKSLLAEGAYSNLKPADKAPAIDDVRANNPNMDVAYCGDGAYDIAALAKADVGIAMGAVGSDFAFNASDVVLLDNHLENVAAAVRIAKKTRNTAVFNIVLSFIFKLVSLALLALPFFEFKLLYAVIADLALLIISTISGLLAGK